MSADIVVTRAKAEARAERIRAKASGLVQEITDAYTDGDHLALGYESWREYCAAELDGRVALPRVKGDRVQLVKALADAGMSQRAVAEATGIARNTVSKYVNPEVAQIEPPEDARALTDSIKAERTKLDAALDQAGHGSGSGNTVFDVLCDPWIIRAIQLESVTPLEAAMSALRIQNDQTGANVDEQILDGFIIGLLTRTGRYVKAFDPALPLSDIYQKED